MTDVVVPGWVDRDDAIPQFRPQPIVVYLLLDEGVLKLASVGQYDQLAVSHEDSIRLDGIDLFDDAEDEVIVSSCGEQIFGDGWDGLRCTGIRYFSDAGSSLVEGVVKCLGIELESRYWIFFDPTWAFGIKIGNGEDLRRWKQENTKAPSSVTEHVWTREDRHAG
ncbi:hypothetical protein ACWCP6_05400 [Streptomyces sp. NPDC002004]